MIKLFICLLLVSQVVSQCDASYLYGIASGVIILGSPASSQAQTSYTSSLSGFTLGENSEIFYAVAIAGLKGAAKQQFYSLVVENVTFQSGNTQMKLYMNYHYFDPVFDYQTSWVSIKLSWLAVSSRFHSINQNTPQGQDVSYVWATTVGLSAPFSGVSQPVLGSDSPFVFQTTDMINSPQCGYINGLNGEPGYFDLNCAGQPNARFLTHSYIMGFQFNPEGTVTFAASSLQGNGGTSTLSDTDQALDFTYFVTNDEGQTGNTLTGPRLLIRGFDGMLQYLKIAIVITTILDITNYPGSNTATFQYSGIYMGYNSINQIKPMMQSQLDESFARVPNSQNYNYFTLINAKYQIFGLSSFIVPAMPNEATTIDLQLTFPDLNSVLLESSIPNFITDVRISGDRWNTNLNICPATSTVSYNYWKKHVYSFPQLRAGDVNIVETQPLKYVLTISPKNSTDPVSAYIDLSLHSIVPQMAYLIQADFKSYNSFGKIGFSSPQSATIGMAVESNQIFSQRFTLTVLSPGDADKVQQYSYNSGFTFTTASPTINTYISTTRDLANTIMIQFTLKISEYPNIYDPSRDCCAKLCPPNTGVNILTVPPTCVLCTQGLIFNPMTRKCQCKANTYPVIQKTAAGVSLGIMQCYPCSSKLVLCQSCTQAQPQACTKCVYGAQYLNEAECSCSSGFYRVENFCNSCPYKCLTCTSFEKCTSCPANSQRTILNGKCVCKSGFQEILNFYCCPAKTFSIIVNGTCFPCSSLKGKNGTGQSNLTSNTCICNKSFVFDFSTASCICPFPNSYIDKNGLCISCFGVTNSTKKTDSKTCLCNPTYIWNPAVNLTACLCAANSIIASDGTCFSCSVLKGKNSNGLVETGLKACQCNKSFVFNSLTLNCSCPNLNSYVDKKGVCFSCTNVKNGTGKANELLKTCICNPSYVWNQAISSTACLCAAGSIVTSNGTCFLCTSLKGKNSTGQVNTASTTNKLLDSCVCNKTFIFNKNLLICLCPDPNSFIDKNGLCVGCSTISNGTGLASPATKTCVCKPTYVYNPTQNKCLCPQKYTVANGECVLANTPKAATENCKEDFVFDSQLEKCVCKEETFIQRHQRCVPCDSTIIKGGHKIAENECSCEKAMFWDKAVQICVCSSGFALNGTNCVECSSVGNSTPFTTPDRISCICLPTFTWNPNSFSCACNSDSIFTQKETCLTCDAYIGSKGVSEPDRSSCLCIGNLRWNSQLGMCVCGANQVFDSNGNCLSCSTQTDPNIVNPPVDAYNCRCADPFFWDNLKNKCVLCNSEINALRKSSQLVCDCAPQHYFDIYTNRCLPIISCTIAQKCINCSLIPHSTQKHSVLIQGKERKSSNTLSLSLNYKGLSDSAKQYPNYGCNCEDGYYWEQARKRCQNIFE